LRRSLTVNGRPCRGFERGEAGEPGQVVDDEIGSLPRPRERPVNGRVSMSEWIRLGAHRGVLSERIRGPFALVLAGFGTATPSARADQAAAVSVAPEVMAAPAPPRRAYVQYGVAFTVEGVAHPGPVCRDANQPCILGSGGGIDVSVGWRPTDEFYLGGTYEFSKQESNKLFRLAILQQVRLELRHYFPTGNRAEPFALFAIGLAAYGNEWTAATWGPSGTLGGGVDLELSGGAVLDVSIAYRPIYLRSFSDSSPAFHDAGLAHFISLQIALEAQDTP
jgi:hypothetical protein